MRWITLGLLAWLVSLAGSGVAPCPADEPKADPARVLEEQRARSDVTAKLLGVAVKTVESEHFIVHTTFDAVDAKKISDGLEEIDRQFKEALGVQDKEFVWTGKVVVYAFAKPEEFATFSEKAHGYQGGAGGAYFRAALDQAELVLPRKGNDERFKQDLTHEATHLLLHFYRRPGLIPNWLQEGLAQWAEFKAVPQCQARADSRKRIASDLAQRKLLRLTALVDDGRPVSADDVVAYAYAWSLVDFLADTRRDKLVRFVRELKDGVEQSVAAKKVFGDDIPNLEPQWIRFVDKYK